VRHERQTIPEPKPFILQEIFQSLYFLQLADSLRNYLHYLPRGVAARPQCRVRFVGTAGAAPSSSGTFA
jgi:hypothetical protein